MGWTLDKISNISKSVDKGSDIPTFEPLNVKEAVIEPMAEMADLLKRLHYQVERLYTVGTVAFPCLFIHEDEVMLLGQHLSTGGFFVEMKHIWEFFSAKYIAESIESLNTGSVECIHYDDGSWGFRVDLYSKVYESIFKQLLTEAIAELREVVNKIEPGSGDGLEVLSTAEAPPRSLFIYEVIDDSLKLSKLKNFNARPPF